MIAAVRISGLPYVWHAGVPDSWLTAGNIVIGGEDYTSLDTLDVGDLSGPEERIEPWAGVCLPGQLRFRAVADDTWLGLLNRNIYRGAVAALTSDASYAGATLYLDDTTPFGASGYVYVGGETIEYTGKTATTLTGCTRGLWGSAASRHATGALVSDHALVLRGRTVWFYVAEEHEAPGSGLVATGVLESVQLTDDALGVELCAGDLVRLIDGQIAEGVVAARIGHSDLIQVDQWSREVSVELTGYIPVLTTDDPASYVVQLPTGEELRTPQEVAQQIATAIGFGSWSLTPVRYEGGETRWSVTCRTVANAPGGLTLRTGPRSLWRELGFENFTTAPLALDPDWAINGLYVYTVTAERARPLLRLPGGRSARIVWSADTEALRYESEATDADGDVLPAVFLVGEEYWQGAVVSTSAEDGREFLGVSPTNRAVFGSVDATTAEIYVPDDGTDAPEIKQLISYTGCEWPRIIGYLLCGGRFETGTTFATTQEGTGLAIPETLVDVAGLEAIAVGQPRLSVALEEGRSVRDVIEPILVAFGYYLHTSNGKLTLERIAQPLATDATTATTIDHDDVQTVLGVRWDMAEDNIVNRVVATDLGRTEAKATATYATSLGTWGATEPVELDLSAWTSRETAEQQLVQIAGQLFARWGSPFCVVELSIASELAWTLQLGDPVLITHSVLPSVSAVARGVTALPGVVFGRSPVWSGGDSRGRLTILVSALDGTQCTEWAPTAHGTVLTAGATDCVITIDPDYYGPDDLNEFEAGDEVRVYERGDEAGAVTCAVTATGATSITVDNTLAGLSAPVEVEFAAYGSTNRQDRYAYIADDSARPYTIDGTDPAYHLE